MGAETTRPATARRGARLIGALLVFLGSRAHGGGTQPRRAGRLRSQSLIVYAKAGRGRRGTKLVEMCATDGADDARLLTDARATIGPPSLSLIDGEPAKLIKQAKVVDRQDPGSSRASRACRGSARRANGCRGDGDQTIRLCVS